MNNRRSYEKISIIGIMMLLLVFFAGCAKPKYTFDVIEAADYPNNLNIKTIEIEPFKSTSKYSESFAIQMKNKIENGIANEGFLKVVSKSGDAILTGDVSCSKVTENKFSKSYKTSDGREYTYYIVKKADITGNYSMIDQKDQSIIIGDSLNYSFSKEWSSDDGYSEARSIAYTDEKIYNMAMEDLAEKIVCAVSPHKTTVTRELETGCDQVDLGNTYMANGRFDQAIAIWDQVIQGAAYDKDDKAAAYYNVGIVKEAQGQFIDAFETFSKANQLMPEEELYIKALTRVENSKREMDRGMQQIRQFQE